MRKVLIILETIKFEHTVFALPFALTGALLARDCVPDLRTLGWILVAMIGARSSAMAFNRIVDLRYDMLNPRTANRALPRGNLKVWEVSAFTVISAGVFFFAAWKLNPLAFALSPVALAVILGYSYTKRFTALSHLVLGLALGIAPTAAWIAVTGRLEYAPVILSIAVMFWTAGFDIIYSFQDIEFDREQGLFSIPAMLGTSKGLVISRLFHIVTPVMLVLFGIVLRLGTIYYVGVLVVALLLVYEQTLVRPDDYSKVNAAFFTVNGIVSIGYFVFTAVDMVFRR
ncbi:MAG: UbiA-like polyprenyltransferase [Armatimonadota bacterium]